jgi:hypothetical protein
VPPNTKAIVVYVDDNARCLEEFSWLYKTWRLWQLDREFDLVAYCNPSALDKLPIEPGLILKPLNPLHRTDSQWAAYPFVNSFAMYNDTPEAIMALERYAHILRTDCDVFLTQHIRGHAPDKLMLGQGGYIQQGSAGLATIQNLNRLREKWGLANSHIHHVGASIFGPSKYVISICRSHFKFTHDIMTTEWSSGPGSWQSGWYAGVSSMYAIDLAVNASLSQQHVIPYLLDEKCWETTSIRKNTLHIHAWHSLQYFSKHEWFKGNYEKLELDRVPTSAAQYCHWIASNTLEELQAVVETSGPQI